jgi:hypothetical protein
VAFFQRACRPIRRCGEPLSTYFASTRGDHMRVTIIEFAIRGYTAMLPIAWITLAVIVCVLIPMAFIRRFRGPASKGMLLMSFIIGITTWLLGAVATFASFGWIGLIIGLVLLGVGVVPLGIVGALFSLNEWTLAISLCAMTAITLLIRALGFYIAIKA